MAEEKTKTTYWIHTGVGLAICAIFWILSGTIDASPITPLGMKCLGAFVSMVYLWTFVDTLWPSVFGLVMIGVSGYGMSDTITTGVGGFNAVWLNAIGSNTVILCLFAFVLFGAFDEVGDTKYIARWLLTRKFIHGHPFAFIAMFYVVCFILSGLTSPVISLIMIWPLGLDIVKTVGIKREDKAWTWFFMGVFLFSTLGQPLLPFKGAPLIPLTAFTTFTASAGNPLTVPMVPYMVTCCVMGALIMVVFLLAMKLMRVNISGFGDVSTDVVNKTFDLGKMNIKQKMYAIILIVFVLGIVVPGFVKGNPICDVLNTLGSSGVAIVCTLVMIVLRYEGKPMLTFQKTAATKMQWSILFMIAAAVYAAGTLSAAKTGVTVWLKDVLNPILGGLPEMAFVALMFTTALIITNFANNAAMATVLTPIAYTFSVEIGINPVPVEMGIVLMVFVAMLTPSASPHAGMMWGKRDIYTPAEILKIGLPSCLVTLISYIVIGYPLMKMMLG